MVKGGSVPGWVTRSRRGSEPPLTADELHRLRWGLGGALALVSFACVYALDLGGAALVLPLGAALLAAIGWPAWTTRVPPWAWRLVFPGLILFVALDWVLNGEPTAAMLRLNLLLIAVRAVGPRRPREDLQLLLLCLLLVVVSGALTVAFGFVLHILVFTALALSYLLAITLSVTGEPEEPGAVLWCRISWDRLLARLRRAIDWRLVAAVGGLYLLVVAVASLLFLALPRFQIENSLGLLQLKNRRALSGFSDTVKLGEVTEIAQDTTTALRAELSDPERVPVLPYWRMAALDDYRDGTFGVSRGLLVRERRIAETRELAGRGGSPGLPNWTFYYEAGVSRYLPLAGGFVRMQLREPRALMANPAAGTLALRDEPQAMFAYRVEGLATEAPLTDVALARELRSASPGSGYPWTLLAIPAGAANAAALDAVLAEITGGARLEAAPFAARAVDWLERRHRYATRSAVPSGAEDVVVRWLRSAEPGHCELFAGAFTLLARRAGFPVRVVTGFKGGAWNAFERYYMVRNSDAHAWCELLDERGRWVRVDPTPGATAAEQAAGAAGATARAVDRSWMARLDALRMLWYRRIVNFDRGSQAELVDTLKVAGRRTGLQLVAQLDSWGRRLRAWFSRPWGVARASQWLGCLAAVGGVGWAAWHWRVLWWGRWRGRPGGDPVRREAGRWLRRLEAANAAARAPEVAAELQILRYGPAVGRPSPLAVFRRARRIVRQARWGR